MELELFSWDRWDQADTLVFVFYDATLKIKIGDFEVGTKFPSITMDYGYGIIQLYTDDANFKEFKLRLSIV